MFLFTFNERWRILETRKSLCDVGKCWKHSAGAPSVVKFSFAGVHTLARSLFRRLICICETHGDAKFCNNSRDKENKDHKDREDQLASMGKNHRKGEEKKESLEKFRWWLTFARKWRLIPADSDQSQAARGPRGIDLCRPLGLNGCSFESRTVVTRTAAVALPSFLFFSRKFQPTDFLVPPRARARRSAMYE